MISDMFGSLEGWLLFTEQATALVKATEFHEIAQHEARFGFDQQTAVAHFLESTEWGVETFPEYQEGKGSFPERLATLRAKWADWEMS